MVHYYGPINNSLKNKTITVLYLCFAATVTSNKLHKMNVCWLLLVLYFLSGQK